jgi:hypothetical protein
MKKTLLFFVFAALIIVSLQGQSKTYVTTGGEMIFSFADIENNGVSDESILRWAPVFNIQSMLNADMSNNIGLFTGLAVRNVGYIYGNYTDPATDAVYKKKFRSYNIGIPVGIKIGNLDKMFIYGGYEVEFPFLYKEKTFDSGDKINKTTGWFSDRQEPIQHGFLVGIQFPYGMNVKFKYYLSEFHNQDYVDAAGFKPYEGLHSQVFYFSLSYLMFRNLDFYYNE